MNGSGKLNPIRLHNNIKLREERKVLKRKSGHLRGTMGSGSLAGATSRVEESIDIDESPPQVEEAKYATKVLKSKKLDIALANDSVTASSIKKLLLLGAGGSGKSTIFKQMKVIYGLNYSDAERRKIAPVIYR